MSQNKNPPFNLGVVIGTLGFIAGIILCFTSDNWVIGICGTVASAGIAYQGYIDLKK